MLVLLSYHVLNQSSIEKQKKFKIIEVLIDRGKYVCYTTDSSINLNYKNKEGDDMGFNYAKLLGKIVEIFGTQRRFAEAMGLSERTISLKLNGKMGWKQAEIVKASSVLSIPENSIVEYFFTR